MKNFLLSLIVTVSTAVPALSVLAAPASTEAEVKAELTYRDQIMIQAEQFIERAVNLVVAPIISDRDIECLARNIFYESGSESLEGKVAVGMVTLNRTQDPRYPDTVCAVVKQKTTFTSTKTETVTETVPAGVFGRTQRVAREQTRTVQRVVCQFSWVCAKTPHIKPEDPRWIESRRVAEGLARGGYTEYQQKYANAKHFHAVYVNPGWRLKRVTRTGNHIFYE